MKSIPAHFLLSDPALRFGMFAFAKGTLSWIDYCDAVSVAFLFLMDFLLIVNVDYIFAKSFFVEYFSHERG